MSGTYQPPEKTTPKHIQDAIKDSTARIEAALGTPGGTPPAAPAAPTEPTPRVELPPIPTPTPATPEAPATPTVPATPATPAVEAESEFDIVPQPADTPEAVVVPKAGESTEEAVQRITSAYKSLKGKYDKEVPRLLKANAKLEDQIAGLQAVGAENAALRQQKAELEKQLADALAAAKKAPEEPEITADLEELATSWGVDAKQLAQFERRTIDRTVQAVMSKIPQQMPVPAAPVVPAATAPAAEPPEGSRVSHEKRAYLSDLALRIADTEEQGYETIRKTNADPKLLEFLGMKDKTTGRRIGDIAAAAEEANDASTMSTIYFAFYRWKKQEAEPKKPSQLMPQSHGSPTTLTSKEKPIYSAAQEAEFQRRVRSGHYSGIGKSVDDARKLAAEKSYWSDEFATARAEGRVRG